MPLTSDQLAWLDQTREVRIETRSARGSRKTIIWIVVADNEVYVRSVRGESGVWYRRALADPAVAIDIDGGTVGFEAVLVADEGTISAVTSALRAKYPSGGSLDRMTRAEVLSTTLRLDPVN
jgi:hypothetical protein